jgi:hypothetical protein
MVVYYQTNASVANTIQIDVTLKLDGKLMVGEKPAWSPGRVRITLQAIGNAASPVFLG